MPGSIWESVVRLARVELLYDHMTEITLLRHAVTTFSLRHRKCTQSVSSRNLEMQRQVDASLTPPRQQCKKTEER